MPTAKLVSSPQTASVAQRYELIFDQASDAICTVEEGRVEASNRAFEELTGYVGRELDGESVLILAPLVESKQIPVRTRPFSREMLDCPGTYEDVAIVRKDGYFRLVDLSVRVVNPVDRDLPGVAVASLRSQFTLLIFRDVTAKKQMERELLTKHAELRNAFVQLERTNAEMKAMQETLVQAGKMAALGELAAGIAHELNQPLQAIRGYAEEVGLAMRPLLEESSRRSEVESYLQQITSGVDKMSAIIKYLRTFTRKSTEGYEPVDVHAVIEEALKLLARQFETRGISVLRHFADGLPQVFANPVQLEQVFINLATNARDSIEATQRGSGALEIHTRAAEKFIEVIFRDDGVGMDERTKAKAFNPFFTTKEVGQGMGLGLSLSYGILSKIHGSIMVESELGKGAAFIVRIPVDYRELG
jgi:PAS domain S-box-containing protein